MSIIATNLRQTRESARQIRFEPTSPITATNVQDAIQQSLPSSTSINVAMTPYTVKPNDRTLLVDTSAGPISILMPAAPSRSGLSVEVKDIAGNADVNNITVTFAGGGTMDGLAQVVINNPFGYFKFNPIAAGNYYET